MKEYLFRGKEIKTKKWVYGGFHEHKPSITAIGKQPETEALIIVDGDADWDLPVPIKAYVVEKESVGLYSGFEDKNSVKIFEGDIARLEKSPILGKTLTGKIIRQHGGLWFEYKNPIHGGIGIVGIIILSDEGGEIIGNKSDNPELLKEAGLA
jgi:hypothetical protein